MLASSLRRSFCLAVLALVTFGGCAEAPKTAYRKAPQTESGKQAGFTPAQQQWIAAICPLGMPKHAAGVDFGFTRIVAREGYILDHSAADKIPLWVCERVTKENVTGPLKRPKPEPFAADPDLQSARRAELADYKGSGFDRGHQAPSADQTVRGDLQSQTYFLSNMAPQYGALNQKIWRALEEKVRKLARAKSEIFVITGPMFYDPAEENAATADGYVEHGVIGNGVSVPTHFYKIVLWKNAEDKWEAAAFVMANQKESFPKPYQLENYIKPITWIEQRTGLNFSPNLSGPDVKRIEQAAGTMWN